MLALGVLPTTALDFIKANHLPGQTIMTAMPTPTESLLPGASMLPTAIGSKLTVKNALLGAVVAITGYLAYAMLIAPPKKKAPAASATAAVAGLFGVRYRRRTRRRR
jgi:hypothetical protein